ncbi:2869_t:CDS:2 [Paraglomus occultum]|uniref:2869_t:CDS:1 n=1 Tax=Paraglomus occultum TaxID=144539 RepID=A0A9N8Z8H5_9GLOM|nr:2869_t:CDS:2 [Paraglomus occultum]
MTDLSAPNLFSVKGKVALVTGGGTGIGNMIAKALVRNGAKVYIASRKIDNLEKGFFTLTAASELNALGPGTCVAIQANLNTKAACEQLAADISSREDKLHILVNNSGATWAAPLEDIPTSAWDRVMKLNVYAVYYLTMACLPLLTKASQGPKDPARVLIIGSVGGLVATELKSIKKNGNYSIMAYNTSKAAVHHMGKALAAHLTSRGINVNVIAPGVFPTIMSKHQDEKGSIEETPMGRLGIESDLAGTALYLSSTAGAYVSGAVIPVDGGLSLGSGGSPQSQVTSKI